jgi:biotin-dependent carboxylase-like uncharacterized protein
VGNDDGAAAVELTFGGAAFRFQAGGAVAITGAPAPVRVNGRPAGAGAVLDVPAGGLVEIGRPATGLRCYLAVRGGIGVRPVLGARSRDTLAGLGPPPLRAGDVLPVGAATDRPAPPQARRPYRLDRPARLRVWPGPRADWFRAESLDTLFAEAYAVTTQCDRVGVRLDGPPLHHAGARELPPEGMVCGALQVPPNGLPVLLLVDHPVTGGYPVIGVVDGADLPLAAQLRPGATVRFDPAG